MTISNTEPPSIIAGDSAAWQKTLSDYPADAGWTLSYELVKASTRIAFSAVGVGATHTVTLTPAATAGYAAGEYTYRARVTGNSQAYTVGQGLITVQPAFSAAIDARTSATKTLQAIEDTLAGRATSSTESYKIGDRELKYIPVPELLRLRDAYRRDVWAERTAASIAATGVDPRRTFVRFGGAA